MSNPPPKLTLDESLSALMDGELEELELHRVLKALPDHSDARAKWARYHMVSATLKRQPCQLELSLAMADKVQREITEKSEKTATNLSNTSRASSGGGFAKIAVAASVALAVVTTVQWGQDRSSVEKLQSIASISQSKAVVGQPVSPLLIQDRHSEKDASLAKSGQQDLFMQYGFDRAVNGAVDAPVILKPVAVRIDNKR